MKINRPYFYVWRSYRLMIANPDTTRFRWAFAHACKWAFQEIGTSQLLTHMAEKEIIPARMYHLAGRVSEGNVDWIEN